MGQIYQEGYSHKNWYLCQSLNTQYSKIINKMRTDFFCLCLGFGLWQLGMFHLEPYLSSEAPNFGERDSLLDLVNFEYIIFKVTGPQAPQNGGLRRLVWFQMKHPQVPKEKNQDMETNVGP